MSQQVYVGRSSTDIALDSLQYALDYADEISYSRQDAILSCIPIEQLNRKANAIRARANKLVEDMEETSAWMHKVNMLILCLTRY